MEILFSKKTKQNCNFFVRSTGTLVRPTATLVRSTGASFSCIIIDIM